METELRKRGALVTDHIDVRTNWLDPQTLNDVRGQVPLVYVDAVPVRVDDMGQVTHVGMLLRQAPDGNISRTVVSGRVLLGERIREAL
ncbi:MAG: NUDIX hydrolase family protein, partial [Ilumatobacteraceae bacterium]|nr:NUDIX hydrolase family protein [Ilumatobacteraceae bacterium]